MCHGLLDPLAAAFRNYNSNEIYRSGDPWNADGSLFQGRNVETVSTGKSVFVQDTIELMNSKLQVIPAVSYRSIQRDFTNYGSSSANAAVTTAVMRQLGIVQVDSLEELLATAGVFESLHVLPKGSRVAIVSASGGAANIVVDRVEAEGLRPRKTDSIGVTNTDCFRGFSWRPYLGTSRP